MVQTIDMSIAFTLIKTKPPMTFDTCCSISVLLHSIGCFFYLLMKKCSDLAKELFSKGSMRHVKNEKCAHMALWRYLATTRCELASMIVARCLAIARSLCTCCVFFNKKHVRSDDSSNCEKKHRELTRGMSNSSSAEPSRAHMWEEHHISTESVPGTSNIVRPETVRARTLHEQHCATI